MSKERGRGHQQHRKNNYGRRLHAVRESQRYDGTGNRSGKFHWGDNNPSIRQSFDFGDTSSSPDNPGSPDKPDGFLN